MAMSGLTWVETILKTKLSLEAGKEFQAITEKIKRFRQMPLWWEVYKEDRCKQHSKPRK